MSERERGRENERAQESERARKSERGERERERDRADCIRKTVSTALQLLTRSVRFALPCFLFCFCVLLVFVGVSLTIVHLVQLSL